MILMANDFDYPLPSELIAQRPRARRDQSRLMVLRRDSAAIGHRVFGEIPSLLRPGDLLVVNDTRVIPAKFSCRRRTGGRIEGLFLREPSPGRWEVLLKNAGRCREGESLELLGEAAPQIELMENRGEGRWLAAVLPPGPAVEILARVGRTPLPPYIRRPAGPPQPPEIDQEDRLRYQTVYAARPGAVAAPTAGLHFTERLLAELRTRGIETARVTLHVGLGTFAPVKVEDLTAHRMHREWYELSAPAAAAVNAARAASRRIVAVGTTSVRVLETVADEAGRAAPGSGWTDLFLYPPAEFHATDALITNFHLPRSTLLMLVAAFCSPGATDGLRTILAAYAQAVRERYRFYSYGDAMLIE
jgi:S-adenosylmethionine:tRNA ribosyltransferase-isomerase